MDLTQSRNQDLFFMLLKDRQSVRETDSCRTETGLMNGRRDGRVRRERERESL